MENQYDLAVAYRIYPKVSKIPPIFADDKFKLSELCLISFKKALGHLKIKLFVLLDNCPNPYIDLFKKYFKEDELEIIRLPGIGNAGTFKKQIDILLNQDYSEYIYFAEDDYFYLDNAFPEMLNFLKSYNRVDFISPYYHPDYDSINIHKDFKSEHITFSDKQWQTMASTTMTFLTTKSKLTETKSVFETYLKKNFDASIWLSLTKHKVNNPLNLFKYFFESYLWFKIIMKSLIFSLNQIMNGKKYHLFVPVETLSTHMDIKCLPYGIDWIKYFKETIEKNNFGS